MIVEATSEVAMVAGRQAVSTQVPELYYIQSGDEEEEEAGEKRVTVTHGAMTSRKKVKSSC